jgi:RNA polymerase sigma factor (sigma-70 family)
MDQRDLVSLLEAEHHASFAWALACCRYKHDEAEDILQLAYLRVLDGRAHFDGRSQPRTWLFGVIRNVAREQRRRAAIRGALSGRVLVELVTTALAARPPDEALGTERTAAAIRAALAALSPNQREVIELVAYHDLTIVEAGRVLGMTATTARTHYERAKRRLGASLVRERSVQ